MKNVITVNFTKCNFTKIIWKEFLLELNKFNSQEYFVKVTGFGKISVIGYLPKDETMDIIWLYELFEKLYDKYYSDSWCLPKVSEKDKRKVLFLNENPEISTYLFYSTNVSILQSKENINNWLLQHHMNIRFFCNLNSPVHTTGGNFIFYDDEPTFYDDILENKRYAYDDLMNLDNILEFLIQEIDKEHYINIHLDEYYIPAKDNYQKNHFVHENLVYGYDNNEGVIFAFGFSKNQILKTFKIRYEDFIIAYEKGKIFYPFGAQYLENMSCALELRWLKEHLETTSFTILVFLEKLKEYLYPHPNFIKQNGEGFIFGMNVYELIYSFLEKENLFSPIDFRVFHLLYEHKICLKRRMWYIATHYECPSSFVRFIKEYDDVVSGFLQLKNRFLKQIIREQGFYLATASIKDIKVRKSLSAQMKKLVAEEKSILQMVCSILDNE